MADQGFLEQQPGFATVAIHAGQEPEKWNSAAVVPPITLATTFKQPAPAEHTVSHIYAWGKKQFFLKFLT